MKLILQHVSNPDIPGGYWSEPVDPKKMEIEVADTRAARAAFIAWRERNGLGGGNIGRKCGEVWINPRVMVGRFSYNARFWSPEAGEGKVEILIL